MECLKLFQEILSPDRLSASYVVVNRETGDTRPVTVEDSHKRLSSINLNDNVPEDIRSYFETIKNVFLYGWFVYAFYTVAMFLSFTVIEMASREKFKQDDPDREWNFPKLIHVAKKRGFITEEGFVSVKRGRERFGKTFEEATTPIDQPIEDYCAILAKSIPSLRNVFAHPERDMIVLPSDAISTMVLAAEFINQLFPAKSLDIAKSKDQCF
ncbi:MAG TPA: hypothetical protein VJ746_12680 [Nitrospira sp.]|nr:hypothetical protein [Nitrospira sp.]